MGMRDRAFSEFAAAQRITIAIGIDVEVVV